MKLKNTRCFGKKTARMRDLLVRSYALNNRYLLFGNIFSEEPFVPLYSEPKCLIATINDFDGATPYNPSIQSL